MKRDYRMDGRTVEEFKRDIKTGAIKERDIITRYAHRQYSKYAHTVFVVDNGCDNKGKLLPKSKVNSKADYLMGNIPTEVKFNNRMLGIFRIKAGQLRSYIKQGARILWVNGYETRSPLFTFISVGQLEQISESRQEKPFFPWGGKPCYEIDANECMWFPLNY